jgi:hypothetical protein
MEDIVFSNPGIERPLCCALAQKEKNSVEIQKMHVFMEWLGLI